MSTRPDGGATTDSAPVATRAVFRLPRSAYVAVLFFAMGVTALVQHPILLVLYVVPLLAAVYVARRSTVLDAAGIRVRTVFSSVRVPWSDVRAVVTDRGYVSVVLPNGVLRLPYVRARSLPLLSHLSGGVVPGLS